MLLNRKTAADLVMASTYRNFNCGKGLIVSRNAMTTAEWRALAVSGALNKEQALRLITLGKIKSGQAGHITQLPIYQKLNFKWLCQLKARVAMINH